MVHRVRAGQIYKIQVDHNDLKDSYVRVIQVLTKPTNSEEYCVIVLRNNGECPEYMRVPIWVLEKSLIVSAELLSELRFKAWFRRLSWWKRVLFCIRCVFQPDILEEVSLARLSSSSLK